MSASDVIASLELEVVYGWKEIARVLKCSVRKAQELSHLPAGKGPPIEHGHNGVCAVVVLLRLWMRAQTVDIRVYRERKRARSAEGRGTVKDAA